jgi:hypothetical protein
VADDYERLVPNGKTLKEAVSVIIKELRRGKEAEALYWARQMEGGGFYKYLWRRLCIFAAEDVGLGNPMAIVIVNSCRMAYIEAKAESGRSTPDGNLIAMAVLVLCRSTKNREVDNLKNVVNDLVKQAHWEPSIPEYAHDMHTKEGRERLGDRKSQLRHWALESSHVEPEVGPFDGRLWHLRNFARMGVLTHEEVEAQAKVWADAGELVYGIEGAYPVVPGTEGPASSEDR